MFVLLEIIEFSNKDRLHLFLVRTRKFWLPLTVLIFSVDFRLICSYFVLRFCIIPHFLHAAQKLKFSIKDNFSKSFLRICSDLLEKSLMESYIFRAVSMTEHQTISKPKILMVLNLFGCKMLCTYLCLSISVSKSCHIVTKIFVS